MNYLKMGSIIIGLIVVVIWISNLNQHPSAPYTPRADAGIMDLRDWKNSSSAIVNLDGTWDFYWETFTHSMDSDKHLSNRASIHVPNAWNREKINDQTIPSNGYGTYQLTILIPKELTNKTLGLYIPSIATSYKLWIDNNNVISTGTIATNSMDVIPANYTRTIYFTPNDSKIELTIEVANFSHRVAGLWTSVQLGTANDISYLAQKKIALQLLIVGSLIIMGLYNIFIYFLRRNAAYSLYLGFFCILLAIRTLLVGEIFLLHLFPSFPWELQKKLEYLPIVFGLVLLVKYVHALYPEEKLPLIEKVVIWLSSIFTIFMLLTPALIFTNLLPVFMIVVILGLIYIGYIILRAVFARRAISLFSLLSFSVFLAAVFNDGLYYLNFINTGAFASKGFLIFLLSQTFIHAAKFSEANHQVENLSNELMELNRSLEKKVEDRTHELSRLYSKLRRSEDERKNLISDISHELSKPMTLIKGYSEAIVEKKLPQEDEYMKIIHSNANLTERLVTDLADLSRLESRETSLLFQKVNAKAYPDTIFQQNRWFIENQNRHFLLSNWEIWSSTVPSDAFLHIDMDRMNQVFINVLTNAIKFSPEGKTVWMSAEWKPSSADKTETRVYADQYDEIDKRNREIGKMIIWIKDDGEGIAPEEVPLIFNRLYRGKSFKNQPREEVRSRGLGLAISKEIVEIHNGSVWVKSQKGEGSIFYIALPVYRL